MVKAKKFIYAKKFQGEPKLTDFELVTEDIPALKDGEFLCKAEYLSPDPYQRPYMSRFPIRSQMICHQVAKIVESRDPEFPVGKYVVGLLGWRDYTVVTSSNPIQGPYLLPNLGDIPISYAIGSLGMPGNTAYYGFLEICKPKEGETVVVTGAAGAVGSIVGQIGKIKGCKVIGFAGSAAKCNWLKTDCGFDYAFNYKTVNAAEALKEAAPNGIDCFFDNVGGELSSTIMSQMNTFGRISVCGAISTYNSEEKDIPLVPTTQPLFVFKQLLMEGFIVSRWQDRWMEGIKQNIQWIQEGKIKVTETVTEGFENMPQAFIDMLRGANTGKAIVKV